MEDSLLPHIARRMHSLADNASYPRLDQFSDDSKAITARLEAELSEIEAEAECYIFQEQQLRKR